MVKSSPAMQEATVQFLGQEDPMEKGIASNPLQFSCLDNPMDRADWRPISPWGHKESDTTEQLTLLLYYRLLNQAPTSIQIQPTTSFIILSILSVTSSV